MSCAKCGMPILYGVASYGGPRCMCHTKPNYDHNALADLLKERDQLKEKLWHSEMAATAEAHRVDELKAERDTLRRQLDEARELLEQSQISKSGYDWDAWERNIDAWLERNKP